MSVLWIARHGETTWNLAGRYQGRLESALSALGLRQGFALADRFAHARDTGDALPARIVSSPLLRCRATAGLTATRLGLAVDVDERLIEIGHGTWQGRYRDEIAASDPQRYRAWREDPAHVAFEGGETLTDVMDRWRAFARAIQGDARDTLVVTHDAVVRCALLDLQARPLADFWAMRVENAAFARSTNDGGRLTLEIPCDDAHLGALRADPAAQAL